MLKNLAVSTVLLASLLSASAVGRAQATAAGTGQASLQIGAGVSLAKPDYGNTNIEGISGFVDYDFATHLGVEADLHYVALNTPLDQAENTYLIGPRLLLPRGRFTPYAKVLAGIGSFVIQERADNPGLSSASYFAYGFGGGLDIRISQSLVVRAFDAEFQKWPGFGKGISPLVVTVGVAYKFR
jgi:Outer membrane protein beta-barrel domain